MFSCQDTSCVGGLDAGRCHSGERALIGPAPATVACWLGAAMSGPQERNRSKWLKLAVVILTIVPVVILATMVAFHVSPWPSALLIRRAFEREMISVSQALEKHVPPALSAQLDERYDAADPDA